MSVDNQESLKAELETLAKGRPKLWSLIEACPYDPHRDCDGTFTETLFYSKLFVKGDRYPAMIETLNSLLDNEFATNRLIFLSGYSGSGKTTFLRHFFRMEHPKWAPAIYIDFRYTRDNILGVVRNWLLDRLYTSADTSTIRDSLQLLAEKPSRFLHHLCHDVWQQVCNPSSPFVKNLPSLKEEELIKLIQSFPEKDLYILFFLHLFQNYQPDKQHLIIFDNLDVASNDYLAQSFREDFANALTAANLIAKDPAIFPDLIYFVRDYTFILSLRDANNVYITAHLRDSIGTAVKVLDFRFFLSGKFYCDLMDKRVALVRQLKTEFGLYQDSQTFDRIVWLVEMCVQKEDLYFQRALVPLFNYDIKQVIVHIQQFADIDPDLVRSLEMLVSALPELGFEGRFGIRGAFLYVILQSLLHHNFVKEILATIITPSDSEQGYCLLSRMCLAVLLYQTRYSGCYDQTMTASDYTGLYSLLHEFRFDAIYSIHDIIETLAKMYLVHEQGFTHLVTIKNRVIRKESDLKDEEDLAVSYAQGLRDRSLNSREAAEIEARLNSIQIGVNPAGFAFLRYVVPHFEYYSHLAMQKSGPLFLVGGEETNGRFAFENRIDAVLNVVKAQLADNVKFFARRFRDGLGMTPEDYRRSAFTVRTMMRTGHLAPEGDFYMTRVLTSHIDYLDVYRRYLCGMVIGPEKKETQRSANEKLIRGIERYIALLRSVPDDSVVRRFVEPFLAVTRRIREGGYKDFSTPVRLAGPQSNGSESVEEGEER